MKQYMNIKLFVVMTVALFCITVVWAQTDSVPAAGSLSETTAENTDTVISEAEDVSGDNSDETVEEAVVTEEMSPLEKNEPESYIGWRVTSAATVDNPNMVEITTFAGRCASIFITGGFIEDDQLEYIGRTLDAAWTIPGLQVKQASVYVEAIHKFRFVIIPESFVYEGTELKEYFPAGIAFWYDEALFYDVVMKVRELKPRVTGTFVSPSDFALILYRATIVPDLYMYDNNLVERVERLEKSILALAMKSFYTRPYQIDEKLIQIVKNMYNENKSITKKDVMAALKAQKIKYSTSEIDTIFVVLLGVYN